MYVQTSELYETKAFIALLLQRTYVSLCVGESHQLHIYPVNSFMYFYICPLFTQGKVTNIPLLKLFVSSPL